MSIEILIENLLPLYLLLGIGFVAGRYFEVSMNGLANLLIFVISPIVFFGSVAQLDFNPSYILLPIVLAAIGITVALGSEYISRRYFSGNIPNLIGMLCSAGNTGYFGLPFVLALFGAKGASIYMLANLGISIAQNTMGYYLGARGAFTVRQSVIKVLQLPALHAIWLALLWNYTGFELPPIALTYWERFTGAWIVFGVMLVGIALGEMKKFHIDMKLLSWLFVIKFLIWPGLTFGFALLDKFVLGLYGPEVHIMLLIFGIVPLPANGTANAVQLKVRPEDATIAIFASTLFATIYIPLVMFGLAWAGLIF